MRSAPDPALGARRSDAARNRERLLAAARVVFAQHGENAPLEKISTTANVSRTTLYRHFPTRVDLAETIYEDNVVLIEQRARELALDPSGVVGLFDYVLDLQVASRSVALLLIRANMERYRHFAARTTAAFQPLTVLAGDHGVLHEDVSLVDILAGIRMAETAVIDDEGQHRTLMHDRCRMILKRGLFRTQPGAAPTIGSITTPR